MPVRVRDPQRDPFLLPLLHAHHQRVRMRSRHRSLIRERRHPRRRHPRRRAVRRPHHIQVAALRPVIPDVEHDPHRKRPLNIHVVRLHHPQPIILVHRVVVLNRLRRRTIQIHSPASCSPSSRRRRHASRRRRIRIRRARHRQDHSSASPQTAAGTTATSPSSQTAPCCS